MSDHSPRRFRPAAAPAIALAMAVATVLAGCTGGSDITADPAVDPNDRAATTGTAGSASGEGTTSTGSAGPDGVGEPDLIVLADDERAEDPALPPSFDDDDRYLEPGDLDHVADPEEAAPLDQGSALACAAIEIGRNALAEGDTGRIETVSGVLSDDGASIGDARLRAIAAEAVVEGTLDRSGLDEGLARCRTLGYDAEA